jgi:S-adenosylmethionine:tRNA ribosyltransferase-isomerase
VETSSFDFELPAELIAQHPVGPRDRSRLMVVRRVEGRVEHRVFQELPGLLAPGDVLVRNDTRVIPARLEGRREATGGRWEGLFLRAMDSGDWEVLATTRGKPAPGESVLISADPSGGTGDVLRLTLVENRGAGRWAVRPGEGGPPSRLLERYGRVPLPPYIRKGREGPGDRQRYQTVFARSPGSVAAPTAGLHFTEDVFRGLDARGVAVVDLTLHVGPGTFRPIEADRVEDHVMHSEWAELTTEAAAALNARRASGGKVVAVGTTSARVLETAVAHPDNGPNRLRAFSGDTSMFIRPGHQFRGTDSLLTNFHLPRSSLIVLVSAFAGVELTRDAYTEAVKERYRFYSYGDAMLIL